MSIRSIVTMGYSNGTFSIGTSFLPPLGYRILVPVDGPGKFITGQIYLVGFYQGQVYLPEIVEGDFFLPEIKQSQIFKPEYKQGEIYNPGFQQAQREC